MYVTFTEAEIHGQPWCPTGQLLYSQHQHDHLPKDNTHSLAFHVATMSHDVSNVQMVEDKGLCALKVRVQVRHRPIGRQARHAIHLDDPGGGLVTPGSRASTPDLDTLSMRALGYPLPTHGRECMSLCRNVSHALPNKNTHLPVSRTEHTATETAESQGAAMQAAEDVIPILVMPVDGTLLDAVVIAQHIMSVSAVVLQTRTTWQKGIAMLAGAIRKVCVAAKRETDLTLYMRTMVACMNSADGSVVIPVGFKRKKLTHTHFQKHGYMPLFLNVSADRVRLNGVTCAYLSDSLTLLQTTMRTLCATSK